MSWRIVLALVTVGLAAVWSTDPRAPRIDDAADRPVTIATLPCARNLQAMSSGYVFDDELVVTVAHAVHETRDLAVRDSRGDWHDGFVRHLDLERDLALVQVEGLRATPVETGDTAEVDEGDRVQMLEGAASGTANGRVIRPVRIRTQVVGDRESESLRQGFELALEIAAGDSGAGVVNREGELVAIVFSRSTTRERVTWATSVSEVDVIRDRTGVPAWPCDPAPGVEIDRRMPRPDELAAN